MNADATARLAQLLNDGLRRADLSNRRGVQLRAYSDDEQRELADLLHAYLWDRSEPFDDRWHRSPGQILSFFSDLTGVTSAEQGRLQRLRIDLVKELTSRGQVLRTNPRSTPILVREYRGVRQPPLESDDPRRHSNEISMGSWGAGYGDAERNRQIELAAERVVTDHYRHRGWEIVRVAEQNCGWDLTMRAGNAEEHVEVKGASGRNPSILLTRNELRAAEIDALWCLAVMTEALRAPTLRLFSRDSVISAADPSVFRVNLALAPTRSSADMQLARRAR